MSEKKLVIISDLHIGGDEIIEDFNCEKELIAFLDKLDENKEPIEFMILGDFFDLWKIEKEENNQVQFAINQYKKLFERFREFGKRHKITVLAGNHDHALAYNKKYQEDLANYNIHVDKNQFFKREFEQNGKKFRIIGEHGNQVEPGSAFPDFDMPTDSSLAYHLNKTLVYRVMKLGNEKNRPEWLKDLDNVDNDLVLFWFLSKYFYYELGPILRAIVIPMFILFGLAVPYFIFDIVTEFYHPRFLEPILLMLDTNIFFKFIIFLLYFDMVVVIILFFLGLVRNDFRKRLNEYGMQSLTEILVSKHKAYVERAKEIVKGENPFKEKADFYITGHTHISALEENKEEEYSFGDTGSWKQLMKRLLTRFRFPTVYAPYYSLTYLIIEPKNEFLHIQLRELPKDFIPQLTLLERLAIKGGKKKIPKPIIEDSLIKELKFEMN